MLSGKPVEAVVGLVPADELLVVSWICVAPDVEVSTAEIETELAGWDGDGVPLPVHNVVE